jgi:two-component system, OmpR family, manganese sensing response regulator
MDILLVDDETELTKSLSQILSLEGYRVDVADNGIMGFDRALNYDYDLLILDWMLPHKSGIEICQELRRLGKTNPVLFLTAKDTLDDRVLGLDVGGDDYLVKPFQLRELLARVRALLRRSIDFEPATTSTRLKVVDLELDSDNQLAYRHNRIINLSEKEFQLLEYFMNRVGQLLTHEQIYRDLWTEKEQPSSNVLAALVRLLRRKIESEGEDRLIFAVYGKGYRFGGESK